MLDLNVVLFLYRCEDGPPPLPHPHHPPNPLPRPIRRPHPAPLVGPRPPVASSCLVKQVVVRRVATSARAASDASGGLCERSWRGGGNWPFVGPPTGRFRGIIGGG